MTKGQKANRKARSDYMSTRAYRYSFRGGGKKWKKRTDGVRNWMGIPKRTRILQAKKNSRRGR